MASVKIASGSDPFKKYWWVILVAFAGIGGWICLPAMDSGTGGSSIAPQESGLQTTEQSLDSAQNPAGAQGSALDLTMGASHKRKDEAAMSSLYQAPEEKKIAAATPAPADAPKFADALKDISRASAAKASAKADASGWGEKAQRGFTAPKAAFGGLSGLGGGSGSGASSSSSGGGLAGSAVGGFGGKNANTGVSFAKGLKDTGSGSEASGSKAIMKSLEAARGASVGAAVQQSNDAAKGMSSASFDGGGKGGSIGGGGAAQGASAGLYGKLDSAPSNLKVNDPNLNNKKIEAPPTPIAAPATDPNAQMKQMVMQMLMSVVMAGIMACIGL